MNSGFEAVWLYIKALLPPGLEGALEPGGRENGIIPTNFHGLDFEIFGLVVEQASGDERNFRDFKAELHPDDDGILHQEDIQTIIRGAREMRIFTGAPERS